jgi:hypothetical protein
VRIPLEDLLGDLLGLLVVPGLEGRDRAVERAGDDGGLWSRASCSFVWSSS